MMFYGVKLQTWFFMFGATIFCGYTHEHNVDLAPIIASWLLMVGSWLLMVGSWLQTRPPKLFLKVRVKMFTMNPQHLQYLLHTKKLKANQLTLVNEVAYWYDTKEVDDAIEHAQERLFGRKPPEAVNSDGGGV